jgi:prepilin-type N-terminal cleavage/methylation domain-containing protein
MKFGTASLRSGFTLVEVMVTMAIGSIILFVAATVLSRAGDGYDRSSGNVAAEREARAALTQMAGDLAKAEWHKNTILENGGSGWKQAKLGILSLQADDAQSEEKRNGDLCAVHYYIKDVEVGGALVRCLMRGFRESGDVFPALKNGTYDALFAEEDADEPVAFGVVSFSAEPLQRDGSGKWESWNGDTSTAPAAVRVKLVVARRELLGKLVTTADWSSGRLLGNPEEAHHNRNLETYEAIQRFGNDA